MVFTLNEVISLTNYVSFEQLKEVYNLILKEGITTYKTKYSKASLPAKVAANKRDRIHKKGAIFAVRSKDHFTAQGVKGYIITSKETLLEDASQLTHFTPNVYRKFTYTDEKRTFIKGFEEKNLLQINAFVVDIDTKKHTEQDILLACMDHSIGLPTGIISTERGYQVYFALTEAYYISNKHNYRSLTVAKRIADNLKRSLQSVSADMSCNDFGFFRIPKPDNIVWLQLDYTYEIAQLINWSMRRDDDLARPLFVVPSKTTYTSITQTEWFTALIQAVDIKGNKGRLGRNNAMFTLALACFADGWEKENTFDFLDQYNSRLTYPLELDDIETILDSAYSGKYKGAKKEYIEALLAEYIPGGEAIDVQLPTKKGWYKFKKEREDRTRSHYEEWEQDIIDYITAQKMPSEPFIWRSQKELCKDIGIPQSTLNEVLKRSKKLIKTVIGKGRAAKTGWTTVNLSITYVLQKAKDMAEHRSIYQAGIQSMISNWTATLEPVAGYETLIQYLTKLNLLPQARDEIRARHFYD